MVKKGCTAYCRISHKRKGCSEKECITSRWWNKFLKRQGDLSLRRGESTAHVRMDAINRETIGQYFSLLKNVLNEHNLAANPERIYNVDETGMPVDFKTPNIVAKTGSKKVRYRQSGKKGQVSNGCSLFKCCRASTPTNGNF